MRKKTKSWKAPSGPNSKGRDRVLKDPAPRKDEAKKTPPPLPRNEERVEVEKGAKGPDAPSSGEKDLEKPPEPDTKIDIDAEKDQGEKELGEKDAMDEDKIAAGREKRKREEDPVEEREKAEEELEEGRRKEREFGGNRKGVEEEKEEDGGKGGKEVDEEEAKPPSPKDKEGCKGKEWEEDMSEAASSSDSEMSEDSDEGEDDTDGEEIGLAAIKTPEHAAVKIFHNEMFEDKTEMRAVKTLDVGDSSSDDDFVDC
ncbi:hypothetical protein CBR_g40816 [Chara braunii]|uniref:Uncharacterized protein n=1 Tax=Chara braunii TaxID=69332 RepID=A0A388LUT8_CHABU|nr:hypothetical protein CBR_g40816 [Chara braunii]|eukprot:GBG86003.1 hypothetical protein CBR_g40816 [Chara braunii]